MFHGEVNIMISIDTESFAHRDVSLDPLSLITPRRQHNTRETPHSGCWRGEKEKGAVTFGYAYGEGAALPFNYGGAPG
jgi:hypothetical protein